MTNFVTMQNRISNEVRGINVNAASRISSEIQSAIQTAIKYYERHRFYFNSKVTGTFSTVIGQEYYAAAANADIPNIVTIDAAKLTLAGGDFQAIAGRAFTDMDAEQTGSVSGDPTHFAYYAQQIRLYPKPDAVRTVTMAYIYRLAALVAGTDTNAWMTDAEALIRQRAKKILAMDVLGGDPVADKIAERAALMEKEELEALLGETRMRRAFERLQIDDGRVTPPIMSTQKG